MIELKPCTSRGAKMDEVRKKEKNEKRDADTISGLST